MSTLWGYQCKQHKDVGVVFARTGYLDEIKLLLSVWPQLKDIVAFSSNFITVNIEFDPARISGEDSSEIWEFLKEHFSCGLLLLNEYGDTEEIKNAE